MRTYGKRSYLKVSYFNVAILAGDPNSAKFNMY